LLDNHWCEKQRSILFRFSACCLVLFFVGLSIELIQIAVPGRSFTWIDLFRDVSGGLAFLSWKISSSVSSTQTTFYRTAAFFILLVNCIPLGRMGLDEYRARRDFPLLSGFENSSELSRWNGGAELSQSDSVSLQGKYSGMMRLTTEKYSGISLRHFQGDWSGRNGLTFSIFNPGAEITLHYRVHDSAHRGDMQAYSNRFNGKAVLSGGWTTITIPMADILTGPRNRPMDLTHIEGFGVFVIRQNERRVLYIDDVRLF